MAVPGICIYYGSDFRTFFFLLSVLETNFNTVMFGVLGNTWRYKFFMAMLNDINLERLSRIFDSHLIPLNQRYTPTSFPICLYRNSMY